MPTVTSIVDTESAQLHILHYTGMWHSPTRHGQHFSGQQIVISNGVERGGQVIRHDLYTKGFKRLLLKQQTGLTGARRRRLRRHFSQKLLGYFPPCRLVASNRVTGTCTRQSAGSASVWVKWRSLYAAFKEIQK